MTSPNKSKHYLPRLGLHALLAAPQLLPLRKRDYEHLADLSALIESLVVKSLLRLQDCWHVDQCGGVGFALD